MAREVLATLRHAVMCDKSGALAELFEREFERQPGANGIAVGTDMGDDQKVIMRMNGTGDFIEWRWCHDVGAQAMHPMCDTTGRIAMRPYRQLLVLL